MVKFVTVPACLCFWWMCFWVQKATKKEQMEFRSCHSPSTVGWAVVAWKPWCFLPSVYRKSTHREGCTCKWNLSPPDEGFSFDLSCWMHACKHSIRISLVKQGWARWVHRGQLFLGHVMPLPNAEEGFIRWHFSRWCLTRQFPFSLYWRNCLLSKETQSWGPGHLLSSNVKGHLVRAGC